MSKEEQNNITDSTLVDKLMWSLLVDNSKSNPDIENDTLKYLVNDDNLPKFKLNEPGPAALANSIFQQNNMFVEEPEQSFVVLGQSSLESVKNSLSVNHHEIPQKSTMTVS